MAIEPVRPDREAVRANRDAASRRARGAIQGAPTRPSRLRLWLRRRRGMLRPAGLGLLGLAGVAVLAVAVTSASLRVGGFDPRARLGAMRDGVADLAGSAGLTVQEVILEGSHNTPLDLVREAVGIRRGDAILNFSPQDARERLETIAWVERAHVERLLPGTIRVRIEERRPFAIWQRDGRFSVIDRDGKVVATDNVGAFGRLPLVVGPGADRAAAAMVDLLRTAPEVLERVHALVRVGDRRWNLRLRQGTDVLLPEGHDSEAIARLTELHAKQGLLDRPLAAIDLRQPDKLVLRLPPPPNGPATPIEPAPSLQRVRSGRG